MLTEKFAFILTSLEHIQTLSFPPLAVNFSVLDTSSQSIPGTLLDCWTLSKKKENSSGAVAGRHLNRWLQHNFPSPGSDPLTAESEISRVACSSQLTGLYPVFDTTLIPIEEDSETYATSHHILTQPLSWSNVFPNHTALLLPHHVDILVSQFSLPAAPSL